MKVRKIALSKWERPSTGGPTEYELEKLYDPMTEVTPIVIPNSVNTGDPRKDDEDEHPH